METSNYSAEAQISLKKAIMIIVVSVAAVVAIGLAVGYKFFWNQFDTTTRFDQEMAAIQDTVKKNPKNPMAHLQMALKYIAMGDNKKAIKELETSYQLDKKSQVTRLYLGIVYKQEKKYDEALKYLSGVIKENPFNFLALVNLGAAQYETGTYQKALDNFNAALKINPGAADVLLLRGKTYAAMGNKDKALADIDKALRFVPDYQEALDAKKEITGK